MWDVSWTCLHGYVDSISKMVPQELGITLQKALKQSPDLRNAYENDDRVRKLIDMSLRLEGLPRHASVHAAGVVICSEPAEDLVLLRAPRTVPLRRSSP